MSDTVGIIIGASGVLAAVASSVAAWFAYRVAKSAFEWQKKQVAPNIQVVVRVLDEEPNVIFIVIENTGKSAAYDVEFELDKPIPQNAWGFIEGSTPEAIARSKAALRSESKTMDEGPLISGIPALAAGDKRVLMWGQYGGLVAWLGDSFVRVTSNYKGEDKEPLSTLSLLEVKSFETTDAGDRNPLRKIAKHLDVMAKFVRNKDWKSTPFIVQSKESYDEQMNEWAERVIAKRENQLESK